MSKEIKFKVNYKDYPEYMFAIVASYLPTQEGDDLRKVAGSVIFRHEDIQGNTYKNGVLHSYNDLPAYINGHIQKWYKDGKLHRQVEGDLPAYINRTLSVLYINGALSIWYKNGEVHRDGDRPAVICRYRQEWWKNGKLHREGDLPAIIDEHDYYKWYKNGECHREGDLPAVINGDRQECWKNGRRVRKV